ncbi:hypothetical protein [Roseateles sp. PN1]|uniref:hypothetical protein n=1 Tax=Roseateles sp. PN1 TaxID=3137372 RepID=UPI00313A2C51
MNERMIADELRQKLYMAAINCPHTITDKKIQLSFDSSKPGGNALNQLSLRLEAAAKEVLAAYSKTPEAA